MRHAGIRQHIVLTSLLYKKVGMSEPSRHLVLLYFLLFCHCDILSMLFNHWSHGNTYSFEGKLFVWREKKPLNVPAVRKRVAPLWIRVLYMMMHFPFSAHGLFFLSGAWIKGSVLSFSSIYSLKACIDFDNGHLSI